MGSIAISSDGSGLVKYRAVFSALALVGLPLSSEVARGAAATPPTPAIVKSTPIRGVPGAEGVIYRQNGIRLGVVIPKKGSPTLIWSRQITQVPVRLSSPGPAGLLQGVIRASGGLQAQVFAYVVRSSNVTSAIAGHPSGVVSAAEGANFHGLSFTLKDPDAGHVGSVKYRFDTTYGWAGNGYTVKSRFRVPDYAKTAYPTPNAIDTTKAGDTVLIRMEIADTEVLRNTGLMNRTSLDPDSGMIFVWTSPVLESFWMENTYIPLSIAFLSSNGTVQEIQDMAALTTTLHTPALPYQYAIEANLGYFKAAGIAPGDVLNLTLKP
jgi:uncharacterized protein